MGLHRSISPDALRKSLNDVGKGGAYRPRGRKPKKAASGQREMLMAISGKGEAKAKGHRQGNKAAGTSAQSRMKSRDRGIEFGS